MPKCEVAAEKWLGQREERRSGLGPGSDTDVSGYLSFSILEEWLELQACVMVALVSTVIGSTFLSVTFHIMAIILKHCSLKGGGVA